MKQRSFQQAWLKMGDEQCAMEMALPTPAIHHPHLIGLDLLSEILAGSEYSKLYQQLYDKQKLVRAVDSYCFTARRSGLFVIRAVLSNGDFSAVTREICNQLSVLRNKKVSDKELRLAKAALKNGLLFEYETADSVAQNLAFYETMFHDPHWPQRHLRTLEDFSSRDLQNLAQLYFRPECISFAGLIPKKQKLKVTQKQIQQILQRHLKTTLTHPPVKQLTSNRKAVATSYKFKENFQLILKSIPQTSIATIFLTIPGGLLLENQNNNGIGNLALSLLNKTNYHKNEQQISLQLTELGADFDVAVGRSNIGLRMDLPAENFEAGLKEFFSLILRPEFNQTIFNRERNFIQQELAGLKDNYEIDCFNYFLSTLFPDHSYGLNPLGKQSALKRLNAQKLKEWYLKQQLTLPWTLTIVSSQSDPQVLKMLRKFSNRLPKLKTFQHQRITDKTLTNRRYEKNIPGHKAYYCYGFKTPGLLPKVWPAVEVLTAVLTSYGGGLLYERLRDKLGLAYTVQSYAYHAHEGGYMAIYVNTAPENLLQVERETVKLFHRLRKNGISLTEINRAKNFLTGSYEIDLQRTSSQAMQLAINYQNGHGCNLSSYQKAVNKVSMQDIRFCLENFITESLAVTAIHSPTV
jgi:zinc protease